MEKNDFVAEMFEEIKESMIAINKKLELEKPTEKESKKAIQKQFLEFVSQSIYKSIRENILVMDQSSKGQLSELKLNSERLDRSIKEMIKQYKTRRLIFQKLIVWQVISAFLAVIGVFLLVNNQQMRDSDLKFKYIQTCGGINTKDLSKLDTIFHVNRDEMIIEKMRERVNQK